MCLSSWTSTGDGHLLPSDPGTLQTGIPALFAFESSRLRVRYPGSLDGVTWAP
jgi:hypothetical protein